MKKENKPIKYLQKHLEEAQRYINFVKTILNNESAFQGYTPDNVDMFKTIQPTLNEIEVVYAQERTLFSHHLKTAGRVDCVGKFRGKTHIIDFKTSNKPKKWEWIDNYFMQGSAYSVMWEEMTRCPVSYSNNHCSCR